MADVPLLHLPRRTAVFLLVEAFSAIGSWATLMAIWGYAAFEFEATAREVSLFGLAFSLPPVLLGPLSGTAVDRFGSRTVLGAAKALGVVASLLLLVAHDFRSLALLAGLNGVASAFAMPALHSMPPRLVDDAHLARTNSLVALTDQLAIVLGPVAGAIAITWFGFRGAFVFDAITFAVGIAVLPIVRLRATASDSDAVEPIGLRESLEGFRTVARRPALRRIVGLIIALHFLYGASMLIEPLYVRDVLEQSPRTFALLQTIFGVFLVLSGIVVTRLGDRLATTRIVAAGIGASGASMIVYLFTPWLAVAAVGVSIWGVVTGVVSGPSRTVIQRNAPPEVLGRVMASESAAASGGQLLGLTLGGLVVSALDIRPAVLLFGTVVVVIAAVGGGWRLPRPAEPATSQA